MGFLRRLREFFLDVWDRDRIAWVSEESVIDGFRRVERELGQELREIAAQVRATEGVAYLIFDFRLVLVWDAFPISVYTFDAEGRDCDCPANERDLLPGRPLLGPAGYYPLGRIDWMGADTTPDAALVERVFTQQFCEHWARLGEDLPGVRVLVGAWSDSIEFAADDRPAIEMLDIATGEPHIVTWYTLD